MTLALTLALALTLTRYTVEATSEALDEVVAEQACIMKLDVEGYEPTVLAGAKAMLRHYPPKAILTEYAPARARP